MGESPAEAAPAVVEDKVAEVAKEVRDAADLEAINPLGQMGTQGEMAVMDVLGQMVSAAKEGTYGPEK